jgi:hypothetical protein
VRLAALPPRLQADLQEIVTRSDRLAAATKSGVTFGLDRAGNVVLRGTAASTADVQTLENMLRFAPGVHGVRNEMRVR